jgi:hypothetical protein
MERIELLGGLCCPSCGSTSPLLWASEGTVRTYRCGEPRCGRSWSVDGQEVALPLEEVESAQLRLI